MRQLLARRYLPPVEWLGSPLNDQPFDRRAHRRVRVDREDDLDRRMLLDDRRHRAEDLPLRVTEVLAPVRGQKQKHMLARCYLTGDRRGARIIPLQDQAHCVDHRVSRDVDRGVGHRGSDS